LRNLRPLFALVIYDHDSYLWPASAFAFCSSSGQMTERDVCY